MLLNCGLHLLFEVFSLALASWATLLCQQRMQWPPFPSRSSTYAVATVLVLSFLSAVRNQSLGPNKAWLLFWSSKPERDGRCSDSQPSFLRARGHRPLNMHRRKPTMASGCYQQGPCPPYPSAQTLKACSWAHCPLYGFVFNMRAWLGTCSMVPCPPVSPPLQVSLITSQKKSDSQESLTGQLASKLSPTLMLQPHPAAPHARPDLFTWYWIDGRAGTTPPEPPRRKPVSLLTVPSCELFSRSPLLYIVVTNIRSICWMYMNLLCYFCSLKM